MAGMAYVGLACMACIRGASAETLGCPKARALYRFVTLKFAPLD
jgi:hypothetical protein